MLARSFVRRAAAVAALVLGVLLVAGPSAAQTGLSRKASGSQANEKAKLQLIWIAQNQFAGYYVALKKGLYAKNGIDLSITPGGPDTNVTQSVATGRSDFGVSFVTAALPARENGAPLVNIFQVWQVGPTGLVCRRDHGIKTLKDLKGKTISTFIGANAYPFTSIIQSAGLDPLKDVNLVGQSLGMQPFIQGKVDCASGANYNEHLQIYEAGMKPGQVTTFMTHKYGTDFLEDGVYVSESFLRDHKNLAARFVKASILGWDWAFKHPGAATDIVLKYGAAGTVSRTHQLKQLKIIRDQNVRVGATLSKGIGYMDPKVLNETYRGALKYDVLNKPQNLSTFYTRAVWNEAIRLLRTEDKLKFKNGLLVPA
jgi:NitT/TauT family transport system substrate-binding protein